MHHSSHGRRVTATGVRLDAPLAATRATPAAPQTMARWRRRFALRTHHLYSWRRFCLLPFLALNFTWQSRALYGGRQTTLRGAGRGRQTLAKNGASLRVFTSTAHCAIRRGGGPLPRVPRCASFLARCWRVNQRHLYMRISPLAERTRRRTVRGWTATRGAVNAAPPRGESLWRRLALDAVGAAHLVTAAALPHARQLILPLPSGSDACRARCYAAALRIAARVAAARGSGS